MRKKKDIPEVEELKHKKTYRMSTFILVLGICFIVLGALLGIFVPQTLTLLQMCYILSALIIVAGVFFVVRYFMTEAYKNLQEYGFSVGVILMVVGAISLVRSDVIQDWFLYALGALILIAAVFKFQNALDLKALNDRFWYVWLGVAGVFSILGIIAVLDPFKEITTQSKYTAFVMIADGIVTLLGMFYLSRRINRFLKAEEAKNEPEIHVSNTSGPVMMPPLSDQAAAQPYVTQPYAAQAAMNGTAGAASSGTSGAAFSDASGAAFSDAAGAASSDAAVAAIYGNSSAPVQGGGSMAEATGSSAASMQGSAPEYTSALMRYSTANSMQSGAAGASMPGSAGGSMAGSAGASMPGSAGGSMAGVAGGSMNDSAAASMQGSTEEVPMPDTKPQKSIFRSFVRGNLPPKPGTDAPVQDTGRPVPDPYASAPSTETNTTANTSSAPSGPVIIVPDDDE